MKKKAEKYKKCPAEILLHTWKCFYTPVSTRKYFYRHLLAHGNAATRLLARGNAFTHLLFIITLFFFFAFFCPGGFFWRGRGGGGGRFFLAPGFLCVFSLDREFFFKKNMTTKETKATQSRKTRAP